MRVCVCVGVFIDHMRDLQRLIPNPLQQFKQKSSPTTTITTKILVNDKFLIGM